MLEGRVQKLVVVAIIGVYENNRLVGETQSQQRVFYGGQKPELSLEEMLAETITDQPVLRKVKMSCLLQRGTAANKRQVEKAKKKKR